MNHKNNEYLIQAIDGIRKEKEDLLKVKLIREIEPIEKWLNNPYYVGPDGLLLYDFWKERLIDIFRKDREIPINELVIQGSIGCLHKDTLVRTSEGFLTLEEIYLREGLVISEKIKMPNERIYVSTESGEREINVAKHNGVSDTIRVYFEDGTMYSWKKMLK